MYNNLMLKEAAFISRRYLFFIYSAKVMFLNLIHSSNATNKAKSMLIKPI
jgi:hypothetical protein